MSAATPKSLKLRVAQLRQRYQSVVVMVPDTDWATVMSGEKRMFRSYSRRPFPPPILPTPAIAYRLVRGNDVESRTIWLEDTWQEPLGTVSDEDLRDEGFTSLSDFRRYFDIRYPQGGYRPLARVQVYRVRPITPDDLAEWTGRLVDWLGYT